MSWQNLLTSFTCIKINPLFVIGENRNISFILFSAHAHETTFDKVFFLNEQLLKRKTLSLSISVNGYFHRFVVETKNIKLSFLNSQNFTTNNFMKQIPLVVYYVVLCFVFCGKQTFCLLRKQGVQKHEGKFHCLLFEVKS